MSIFCMPSYPCGVAWPVAEIGASKRLDPLRQRVDAHVVYQGEGNN